MDYLRHLEEIGAKLSTPSLSPFVLTQCGARESDWMIAPIKEQAPTHLASRQISSGALFFCIRLSNAGTLKWDSELCKVHADFPDGTRIVVWLYGSGWFYVQVPQVYCLAAPFCRRLQ